GAAAARLRAERHLVGAVRGGGRAGRRAAAGARLRPVLHVHVVVLGRRADRLRRDRRRRRGGRGGPCAGRRGPADAPDCAGDAAWPAVPSPSGRGLGEGSAEAALVVRPTPVSKEPSPLPSPRGRGVSLRRLARRRLGFKSRSSASSIDATTRWAFVSAA